MNVNYYAPIGGEPTLGIPPDAYIPPGPDQHLDGTRALDFARGRLDAGLEVLRAQVQALHERYLALSL